MACAGEAEIAQGNPALEVNVVPVFEYHRQFGSNKGHSVSLIIDIVSDVV